MLLRDIRLGAPDVAKLLGVHVKTVRLWCENGHIDYFQEDYGFPYLITGEQMLQFLYINPKYAGYMQEMEYKKDSEKFNVIREALLARLKQKPKLYSTSDLIYIFQVQRRIVDIWVEQGKLEACAKSPTYGTRLFTEKAVFEFAKSRKKYLNLYLKFKKGE